MQVGQSPVQVPIQVPHPQQGLHAGEQLRPLEGFGEEVVASGGQGTLLVAGLAQGRHEQDGDTHGLGVGLHAGAYLESGEAGHHEVEDEETGFLPAGDVEAGGAVVGGEDLVAVALEVEGDEFDELAFVVYDEDTFAAGHGGLRSGPVG